MRALVLLLLLGLSAPAARGQHKSALPYLRDEVRRTELPYRYNEYETIISGAAAFVVGNVGFFTTNSDTLKIAYSGVQTVGIITVGQGIYDYYRPNFDRDMLTLLEEKTLTRGRIADGVVSMLGREERAQRLALLWGSGLLVTQYAANAYLSDVPGDIRDIYLFLGGVNVIIAGHSYFTRGKYERYLEREVAWAPFIGPDRAGLAFVRAF